ncbi:DUF1045 domain-containing protein [Mesorhizobium retamae]|uniref:DUF1045 domain-containing protein n=1 Tax=Mesorhizobium retamae TaxID=2912854 RepID=UPI003CCFF5A3
MTLTGPVAPDDRLGLVSQLQDRFLPLLEEEFRIDAITLFEEPEPGADFIATSQFAFSPVRTEAQYNA